MRSFKVVLTQLAVLAAVLLAFPGFAAGHASHVVLMVWDGMRADFVSDETTPTLSALARDGVTFLHHHSVYPSMTEVNATALSTGMYPRESTMLANTEYRPAYDPLGPIGTDATASARKGDELTGGHYLAFPTIAEILQRHNLRTAVAGSKQVALLHDRSERGDDAPNADVFAGQALPESMEQTLAGALGKFPAPAPGKIRQDEWTTRALTDVLWKDGVPAFSLLWMAEPDATQHGTGPGSKQSLAAIKSSDSNLARVLYALDKKNVRDSTDVIIVSDHGFSTILSNIDISSNLRAAGFNAATHFPAPGPKEGDIVVVGNGGEICCYVVGHDASIVTRIAHFLQTQPFTGVVFTRAPVDGAFPLAYANLDADSAPDVVISVRWMPTQSQYGAASLIYENGGGLGPGQGQHASLSPFDMHNICFAAGPDFAKGMKDSLPSGNMDIAPTVLWILGVEPEKKMSGRVLTDALTIPGPQIQSCESFHRQTAWDGDNVHWRQYLDVSTVNGEVYLDEGNGGTVPASR